MNSDHRVDALVRDSLAASQENLHSVEKSTVSHSQERTENGTGLTRGTLQNESQELEMQGHHLEAVITGPYHLPECELATGVYDDRADCICFRLRACEQRVLTLRLDDLNVKSFNAGIDSAEAAVAACGNGKGYIYSDTMTGVEWALDAIRALKERQ